MRVVIFATTLLLSGGSGASSGTQHNVELTSAEKWASNATVSQRRKGVVPLECGRLKEFVPGPATDALQTRLLFQVPRKHKIAWFMSIAKPNDHLSKTYVSFAKAATISARLNAPSLAPYFVYTYLPHQSTDLNEEDELATWLRNRGTRVVKWRLSFWDDIPPKIRLSRQGHINVGAFGRLDVPLIVSTVLHAELVSRGLSRKYVLYTDADIMFARDWPAHGHLFKCSRCPRGWPNPRCCRNPLAPDEPSVFLAGTEVFAIWGLNSGVMLMNVDAMLDDRQALLDYANAKKWNFIMYDQGLLEGFYRQHQQNVSSARGNHAWDSFDDSLYNARGFMTFKENQLLVQPPIVWHWHGFKPYDVECWVLQMDRGTWDLRQDFRSLIHDSQKLGCRGLLAPRMLFPDCSLLLYLQLLAQYHRLLTIADGLLPAAIENNGQGNASTSSR